MFWAKVPTDHLELAVDVLADMVFSGTFDAGELEKERLVVIEELRMYQDNPQEHVSTLFEEVMWPRHPLGWDTAGTEQSVRGLQRDDCLRFLGDHYNGERVVVSVAGATEHERAVELLDAALTVAHTGVPMPAAYRSAEALPEGAEVVRVVNRRTEQANVCFGARSVSYTHPDRFAVDLMTTVLGEGMSSRLFLHLREEQGLAYDVHAFTLKHGDSGAVGVYVGCEPRRAAAATSAAIGELERLATELVDAAELRKARALTLGRLSLQLEGTSSMCTFLGQQELLTGEILVTEQLVGYVEAVTPEDIRRVAANVLEQGLRGAVIGPFPKANKFEKILAGT